MHSNISINFERQLILHPAQLRNTNALCVKTSGQESHRPHTSHAIVGEALTELVHHNEGNAQGVVGATEFLWETNKNISTVKAFTPAPDSHSVWEVERSPVQNPNAHSCLTDLWAGVKGESGPHSILALIKAPQWISWADMSPVRTAMWIQQPTMLGAAGTPLEGCYQLLTAMLKCHWYQKNTFGCFFFCTPHKATTLLQNCSLLQYQTLPQKLVRSARDLLSASVCKAVTSLNLCSSLVLSCAITPWSRASALCLTFPQAWHPFHISRLLSQLWII